MSEYRKPLPEIEGRWSEEFWRGCKRHQLLVQQCTDCARINDYSPRLFCPNCLSKKLKWVETSGKGRIYSFTVVMAHAPLSFQADVPYVVAVIELKEGPRIMSNIVECEPDGLKCDMDVEVTFDDITEEFTLPKFRVVKREIDN